MSIADFETMSKLGDGAFSSVFKVMRKSDGENYALKKVKLGALKQKEKENALNEVRILASVTHPNIIGYKEAFIDEPTNTLCIVMELAEGGDLLKKITTHKSARTFFPENEVWSTLVHVTQGLKVLHDAKILHRDLKCANIFISKDGVMKLGDLNVSKVNKRGLAYTQTGTPYYASPEVWKDQPYNSSSDIWSLGCVIYEMAALAPPFTASDMQGLYKKIIRGVYPNIPNPYSSDLSNVIRTLLQVNPTLRPTCEKILEMPPVQRHIHIQLMPNPQSADLLGTIKFEPGIKNLKQRLPGPQYDLRSRGLSAHSNRPIVEEQPPARIASARGRDPQGQVDGSKPAPRPVQDISRYNPQRAPKPEEYKPQIKEPPKYQPRGENYDPSARKPVVGLGAAVGELYKIPEAKADYSPYQAPYKADRYNLAYNEPVSKGVAKVPSREELYAKAPSKENLNYVNSPNKPGLYQNNKPPSRDAPQSYQYNRPSSREVKPAAYIPPNNPMYPAEIPSSRVAAAYNPSRDAPPSRDYKAPAAYIPARDAPPSRDNKSTPYSYIPARNAPPSRDQNAAPPSYLPSRDVQPSYIPQRNAPPSRDNKPVPSSYLPSRDAPPSRDNKPAPSAYIPSRDAPPSRDNKAAPPSYIPSRDAPPSRDNKAAPSAYMPSRDAPPSRDKQPPYIPARDNRAAAPGSREGRVPSREADPKNFNRIGALVLQSPKQLVPKVMQSPGSNQARGPYVQEKRQQRINPVWWG